MSLSNKDRCKSCKTALHLYCPHEVEKIILERNREAVKELRFKLNSLGMLDSLNAKSVKNTIDEIFGEKLK